MYQFFLAVVVASAMFTTDPETGQMVQTETGVEEPSGDLFQSETEEEEGNEPGFEDDVISDDVGTPLPAEEDDSENQEENPGLDDFEPDPGPDDLLLQSIEEQIVLLAADSSAVAGSMNSQILDLMDRIVNGLPSDFKYAGFRTSVTDAYQAKLYISKKASASGSQITFGDDCIVLNFTRYSGSGTNYIYYTTGAAPGAVVSLNSNSIVYTNASENCPILGESPDRGISFAQVLAVVFFAVVFNYVLGRRRPA